jgi:uncharacterized membrane protein
MNVWITIALMLGIVALLVYAVVQLNDAKTRRRQWMAGAGLVAGLILMVTVIFHHVGVLGAACQEAGGYAESAGGGAVLCIDRETGTIIPRSEWR